jgi:hypothetical protein
MSQENVENVARNAEVWATPAAQRPRGGCRMSEIQAPLGAYGARLKRATAVLDGTAA